MCDLGASGWEEPWFPHSAVLLRLLTDLVYGDFCVLVFSFVFWFLHHTNTWDDTMILCIDPIQFSFHIVVMTDVATALIW